MTGREVTEEVIEGELAERGLPERRENEERLIWGVNDRKGEVKGSNSSQQSGR